jgi:sulfhydrogenase subunit beta (sulfur reductase)
MKQAANTAARRVLALEAMDALVAALAARGYRVLGPTLRDGVVVYDEIDSAARLPAGWTDEQGPGRYRLRRGPDGALFSCRPGAASWKRFLHPPEVTLCRVRRQGRSFTVEPVSSPAKPLALVGARPCELAAIAIQDRVLTEGPFTDPGYAARRRDLFVVAAECTEAGATCFCASLGTGPRASSGFDVALTEAGRNGGRVLLARAGSERGRAVLEALPSRAATAEEVAVAEAALDRATREQDAVPGTEARDTLAGRYADGRWEAIAQRCLGCASCTLVCPTCFCTTVEDTCSLDGAEAVRTRRWDSCFTPEFSHVHGGSVRASLAGRWRHWFLHKFVTWPEQFGTPGCVGCGRCVTWCPAGIDIREELRALSAGAPQGGVA